MTHPIKVFVAVSNETTERLFVMRTMLKSVLVALAAILALSTAIVATASAAEPQWEVKEGGTWKALETGSRKITIKQRGEGVLSIPAVGAEIKCKNMEVKGAIYAGTLSNPGAGEFETMKYSGCEFESPRCGWISSPEQPNGTIMMAPSLPGTLVAKEGSIYYEVKENPSVKEFAHILIHREASEEGGKCSVLSQNETLTGSFRGTLNNATSELEFLGEGTLKLAGVFELKYRADDLMEVEGGGAIRAN